MDTEEIQQGCWNSQDVAEMRDEEQQRELAQLIAEEKEKARDARN